MKKIISCVNGAIILAITAAVCVGACNDFAHLSDDDITHVPYFLIALFLVFMAWVYLVCVVIIAWILYDSFLELAKCVENKLLK